MNLIARNILFSLLGYVLSVMLLLVATPIIVRGLGESSYGVWALVANVVGYLSVFNSLQTAGGKYLAEYTAVGDRDEISKLLSTSLVFNLGIGACGGGLILVLAGPLATTVFSIPPELQSKSIVAFQLAGIGFFLSTVGWWGAGVFAGLQRYDWAAGVSIVMMTVSMSGSMLAAYLMWGVVGVVTANLVGSVLAVGLYGWGAHRLLPDIRWSLDFDRAMFKRIFSFGIFSTLQVVFGILATQMDRTLLGIWTGVAAVTTYAVPLAMATRIHQLCGKALEVVMPVSSAMDARGRTDQVRHLFLRAQNLNVVLIVMLSTPLLVLASETLKFWIGPSFAAEATLVFRLLIVAYGLLALNVAAAAVAAGLGHPELNTGFAIILGLGNLLGYVFLIPRWGVNGAGIASIIGPAFASPCLIWYTNRRFLKIPLAEIVGTSMVRPILAGVITGGLLYFVRPFITNMVLLLFVLTASCLVYLAATIWLGVWQAQEWGLAQQAWRRVQMLMVATRHSGLARDIDEPGS